MRIFERKQLIAQHGLVVQILGGLITYLLPAIYCHENYNEKVNIESVRELFKFKKKCEIPTRKIVENLTEKIDEITYVQKPKRTLLGQTGIFLRDKPILDGMLFKEQARVIKFLHTLS